MAYIIFNTEQEAEARSEQAGIQKGYLTIRQARVPAIGGAGLLRQPKNLLKILKHP